MNALLTTTLVKTNLSTLLAESTMGLISEGPSDMLTFFVLLSFMAFVVTYALIGLK